MVKSRYNNFDFLHIAGVVMVIYGHQFALLGEEVPDIYGMAVSTLGVNLLFCVSGYLVTKSYIKNNQGYLKRRILRIYPELIIYLSAMTFFIGPILSELSWKDYFGSQIPYFYFLGNLVMNPHYLLPGVFPGGYIGGDVNVSLWTLPFECFAYLLLFISGRISILIEKIVKFKVKTEYINLFWIVPVLMWYLWGLIFGGNLTVVVWNNRLGSGARLLAYFAVGSIVAFFCLEKWFNLQIAVILMVFVYYIPFPYSKVLLFVVAAYSVLAFGLSEKPLFSWVGSKISLNYGLYLWGFPAQQMILYARDSFNWKIESGNILFILSIFLAGIFALLSYTGVNKKMLKRIWEN